MVWLQMFLNIKMALGTLMTSLLEKQWVEDLMSEELPGFQAYLTSTSLGPGEILSIHIQGVSEISANCWTWFLEKTEALCS